MACTGVPHIVLHVLCSTHTSGGDNFGPIKSELGVFWPFWAMFLYIQRAKIALILTLEGLKYPPEVRVEHETCSTICGTPVQAILDQKSLTRLAEGVREGLKYGLECASSNDRNGLNLASEPSRGP